MLNLNLRDLKIFQVVAELRNFTKAGEKLFLTQPTVSKAIRKMETELNVNLIKRKHNEILLTKEGELFLTYSQRILKENDEFQYKLSELTKYVKGEIRIGIPQIIGSFIFPTIIKQFKKFYPDLKINIVEAGGVIIEEMIMQEKLDIGFIMLPAHNDELKSLQFIEDSFALCVPMGHRFTSLDTISLIEIKDEPFIIFDSSSALNTIVMTNCEKLGFRPNVVMESTQWDIILNLVSANLGLSIIPSRVVDELTSLNVEYIEISDVDFRWRVGTVTQSSKNTYPVEALLQTIDVIYSEIGYLSNTQIRH